MAVRSKTRWRAFCKSCSWVGKPRRNNLRALEDCQAHWCPIVFEGQVAKLKSYHKGIRRTDG